jgi:hypothetical protein
MKALQNRQLTDWFSQNPEKIGLAGCQNLAGWNKKNLKFGLAGEITH